MLNNNPRHDKAKANPVLIIGLIATCTCLIKKLVQESMTESKVDIPETMPVPKIDFIVFMEVYGVDVNPVISTAPPN